ETMIVRAVTLGIAALGLAIAMSADVAQAFDEAKYPDWSGQWHRPRGVGIQWDQTKPFGARPAGAADAGIPGAVRGEPGRPGQRRAGRGRAIHLHSAWHAAHHDDHLAGRVRNPAKDHLSQFRESHAAPHLYGWCQLPDQ